MRLGFLEHFSQSTISVQYKYSSRVIDQKIIYIEIMVLRWAHKMLFLLLKQRK